MKRLEFGRDSNGYTVGQNNKHVPFLRTQGTGQEFEAGLSMSSRDIPADDYEDMPGFTRGWHSEGRRYTPC